MDVWINEMEIELTLDSGFVCDFTPDFRMQKNTTDQTNLSWRLPSRDASLDVGVLRSELQVEGPTDSTIFGRTDVRLLP